MNTHSNSSLIKTQIQDLIVDWSSDVSTFKVRWSKAMM